MAGIKDWFYAIDVISGWFPVTIWTLVAIGIVVLLICQRKGESRKRFLRQLGIGSLAGIVGLAATYVCSDVLLLFGVSLGWPVIIAIGVGVFLFAFMIAAAVMTHGWLRVLSIVMIPVTLLATAVRANAIYGEYQTMGSLFDYSPYPHISTLDLSLNTISVREWNEQAVAKSRNTTQIPQSGKLVHVDIPNPKSGFKAREALVWLPPAASAKHPPKLPVMVMFAGQPGSPTRFFTASNAIEVLGRFAAEHHGLAPIVVSPDQNTAATRNSLCADTTKWGKAETYLAQDVPDWIKANLPVNDKASQWTIGGFSQGGTCATQLAPNHPNIYGNVLAVDGEVAPTEGSVDHMVEAYFSGDKAAYERQVPQNAIRNNAPSKQLMILGAGARDGESVDNIRKIGDTARENGWTVFRFAVSNWGHDWHAVNAVFAVALPYLCERMGLGNENVQFPTDSEVKEIS